MDHVALDRARPDERHLDHQIVEVARPAGAAAWPSARAIRSGRHRPCRRRRACRRPAGLRRDVLHAVPPTRSSARWIAESMPRARTSTFSSPSASRSSLSHWITLRSAIAAFSTGTRRASGPREMTKPPTCCDRWRGKPRSASASCQPFGDARRRRIETDGAQAIGQLLAFVPPGQRGGQGVDLGCCRNRGRGRRRAARRGPVGDHRRGQRGALAAVPGVEILDDLLAPLMLEIDVDIRRLAALLRDEALEKEVRTCRVDFGDAEA
jgi:hypothetical protein